MEDAKTITLNALLLFVVLLYVYPLKFLFTHLVVNVSDRSAEPPIREGQLRLLMMIYSTGYAAVWGIFVLMYRHAYARRVHLAMTKEQIFETRVQTGAMTVHVAFGAASVAAAAAVPERLVSLAGLIYFLVGPAQWLYWWRVEKRRRLLRG
jgi:hypothetical protein